MQWLVVRPVGIDELVDAVRRERPHLRLETRSAHGRHELGVRRLDAENLARSVAHRGQDDRAGVDDRTVEIEEDDGKSHWFRSYATRTR